VALALSRRQAAPEFLPVRARRPNWPQIGLVVLILALGFYVIYPLLLILLNSFNTAGVGHAATYGLRNWIDAWTAGGIVQALLNTLALAACYQVISFALATGLAWTLARTDVPAARQLEFMFWLSMFVPVLSTTLGWMLLLDPHAGLVNQLAAHVAGGPPGLFNIYSFWGIVWVQLMTHAISFKVMLLTPAFRNMDSALEEAGRASGASQWTTVLRVTLPVMTPMLAIVFLLGLVRLFESFEIEQLLGVPFGFYVYSTKIVQLVRGDPPQLGQAAALGSITLLLLLFAVPLQRRLTMRRSYTTLGGRMRPAPIELGRWRWPVFAATALLAVLLVLVPVASVIAASFMTRFGFFNLPWTTAHWRQAFTDSVFLLSLKNTVVVSLSTALAGVFLFSLVAYVIVRARGLWGRGPLDAIAWVPSVIPGALAGLGLLWMFLTTPVFEPFYGSLFLLVVACLLGMVTFGTQTFKAALLQMKAEMEEAARTSGASWARSYVRVVLPLLAPTLVAVGTLMFLFTANVTSNIIMLSSSSTRTLSLLTLELVRDGVPETAAVTVIIITAMTACMALVARAVGQDRLVR
jgi:iron(III) transport system permease protein